MRRVIALALLLAVWAAPALAADPPFGKNGTVTLPWSEFKALLDKLQAQPTPDDPEPPVPYALGRGELTGVLKAGRFELTAKYPLAVLQSGWVLCPLVGTQTPLADVLLDGKTAAVTDSNGRVALLVHGPATHTLTLRFRLSAPLRPGPGDLSLQLPEAAGQVLEVTVGDKYSAVTVDGATMSRDDDESVTAILTGDDLTMRYTVALEAQQQAEAKLPTKIVVENSTLVSIDEGFVRAVARLAFEVRHAAVTEFHVAVPEGFEVADCTGASLLGWKIDEATRLLTATVGFEVKGSYDLTIVLERSTKEESFAFPLPALVAQNVERERGFFAVQVTGGVEVTPGDEIAGLQLVDPKELPGDLRGGATNPIVLAFKYLRHPFSADLRVVRHQTQNVLGAAIDSANYVVQVTDDGDCVTRAVYAVRNNRKQFLEIRLPGDKTTALWSTFVADRPVRPSQAKGGAILLPLEKSGYAGADLESFNVEIIYYSNLRTNLRAAGSIHVQLPEVDLPISQSVLTVFAPQRFAYQRLGGSMREEAAAPLYSALGDTGAVGGEAKEKAAYAPSVASLSRQSKAEEVFQTRIRAAQEAQDTTGALPARFSVPEQGLALRFSELLTIGGASDVRLAYGALRLKGFLGVLALAIAAALAWFAQWWFTAGRRGLWALAAGVVALFVLLAIGVSAGYAIGGAALGFGAQFTRWVIVQIHRERSRHRAA